ncbi:TPA: tail fiber domain-containing protein [Bacillus cereus]
MAEIDVSVEGIKQTVQKTTSELGTLGGKVENVTQQVSAIDQKANEINLSVKEIQGNVGTLGEKVNTQETNIKQNSEAIDLKAEKKDMEEMGKKVTSAEAQIKLHSEAIEQTVKKTEYEEAVGLNKWIASRYDITGTDLNQTPPAFALIQGERPTEVIEFNDSQMLVAYPATDNVITHYFTNIYLKEKKTVTLNVKYDDSLAIYMNGAKIFENKNNGMQAVKVALGFNKGWNTVEILQGEKDGGETLDLGLKLSTQVDKLTAYIGVGDKDDTRLIEAETSLKQTKESIKMLAEKTEVNELGNKIKDTQASLEVTNNAIKSKVEQKDFDAYSDKVNTTASSVEQLSESIKTKVEKKEYDSLNNIVTGNSTTIEQLKDSIDLKASKEDFDGVADRVSKAESTLSVNTEAIKQKVEKAELDKATGRLTTAEGQIKVMSEEISLTVKKKDFDAVNQGVKDSISKIEQNAETIKQSVTETNSKLDGLQIGSRNYIAKGAEEVVLENNVLGQSKGSQLQLVPDALQDLRNSEIVLSFYAKTTNLAHGTAGNNSVGIELSLVFEDGTQAWYDLCYKKVVPIGSTSGYVRYDSISAKRNLKVVDKPIKSGYLNVLLRDATGKIQIKSIQLERGNKLTDFSVAQEDFTGSISEVSEKTSRVEQKADSIKQTVDTVSKTVTDQGTKLTSQQTSIETMNKAIGLKAEATNVYTKTEADNKTKTAVDNAKAEIKLTTEGISQTVTNVKKDVDGVKTIVESQGTQIKQTADDIALNVVKNDKVISSINASKEGIKISAPKLDITGAVTFESLNSSMKDKINAGTDAKSQIDGMQFGGNNIVSKKQITPINVASSSYDEATNTWTLTANSGAGGSWGAGVRITGTQTVVPIGSWFAGSFEIYTPVALSWNVDVNNFPVTGTSTSNDNDDTALRRTSNKSLKANTWTKCWFTWKNRDSATVDLYDQSNIGLVNNSGAPVTFKIRNVKGELGNVVTAYSLSQEDIDEAIAKVQGNVETVQGNIDKISIGGNNLLLDSQKDFSTTGYLINMYTLSEDWIVGQEYTFVIKGTVPAGQKLGIWQNGGSNNMGYATTTYVNGVTYVTFKAVAPTSGHERTLSLYNYPSNTTLSTVDWVALYKGNRPMDWTIASGDIEKAIQAQINGTGNLFVNSGDFKSLNGWASNAGKSLQLVEKDGFSVLEAVGSIVSNNTIPRSMIKPSTEYVYSVDIMFSKDTKISSISPAHHWFFDTGGNYNAVDYYKLISSDAVAKANTWTKISILFKTKATITNSAYFKAFIYDNAQLTDDNKYWVKGIMFSETDKIVDWSPSLGDINEMIKNVSFGGRNIFLNAGLLQGATNWYSNVAQTAVVDDGEDKAFKFTPNTGAGRAGIYQRLGGGTSATKPFDKDQEYTVSVMMKASKGSHKLHIGAESIDVKTVDVDTTWREYSHTFKGTGAGNGTVVFYTTALADGVDFYVKRMQLEKGNRKTDFTLAPEDYDKLISNVDVKAEASKKAIADMSNDNKATSLEKQQLKKEWATITAEKPQYEALANTYGIATEKTNYVNAYNALNTAITPIIANIAVTSDINGATFRNTFDDYYDKKAQLIKKINELSRSIGTGADAKAQDAKNSIADMSSDSKITAVEKVQLKKEWAVMVAEKPQYEASASSFGIVGERNNYVNAYNTLNTALNGTGGILTNMTTTSSVNGATFRAQFDDYYDKKAQLVRKINDVSKEFTQGMNGRILYNDPMFRDGLNSISIYNNTSGGNVTLNRIAKPADAPTISTHILEIKSLALPISPAYGGFTFQTMSRANAIFLTKIVAKIPVGSKITWASNPTGDNGKQSWLTSQSGTGKWEEYICRVQCGTTGNFSTTNFFAIEGGTLPLTWHVAYATVFDATDHDYSIKDMSNDNKLTPVEKQQLKKEWATISAEKPHYESTANTFGITTEKTNYINAYNALNTFLTPLIANTTVTSDVNGGTFRNTFDDYYDKKAQLNKKINELAKSLADGAQGAVNAGKSTWDRASNINSNGTWNTNKLSGQILDAQIASAVNWNGAKSLLDSWKSGTTLINGGMIATNTIFSQQIAIGDFTNLSQINEEKNPNGYATVLLSNKRYFKIGNGAYAPINIITNTYVEFKVNDEYYIAFNGYRDSGITSLNAVFRYYYTDNTWENAGSVSILPTTADTRIAKNLKITTPPNDTKTLKAVNLFFEKDNGTTNGYYYIRDIEVRKRYTGELVVDGSIKAQQLDVASLFAHSGFITNLKSQNISASNIVGGVIKGIRYESINASNPSIKLILEGNTVKSYGALSGGKQNYAELKEGGFRVFEVAESGSPFGDREANILPARLHVQHGGRSGAFEPNELRFWAGGQLAKMNIDVVGNDASGYGLRLEANGGIYVKNTTNINQPAIQFEAGESIYIDGWGNFRGGKYSTQHATWSMQDGDGRIRLLIPMGKGTQAGNEYHSHAGGHKFFYNGSLGLSTYVQGGDSPILQFNGKSMLKYWGGGNYFEFKNQWDSGFVPVYASAFNTASSLIWKTDIESYEKSALDVVMGTNIVTYKYKSDVEESDNPHTHVGVIAEYAPKEIQSKDGRGVDNYAMSSLAWKAIQELSEQVRYLKEKLNNR